MATQSSPLHMLFFPFLAHGHLLPMVDVARFFALRGVKCTFLTTPANVTYIEPTIDQSNKIIKSKNEPHLVPISISLISFPSAEVGLPEGLENASFTSNHQMRQKFFQTCLLLEKPFEQVLMEVNPDAFVSATFFPWSADVSARTGIPRLVFNGTGLLARSAQKKLEQIIESLPVDTDKFVLPGLPHQLEMHRGQFMSPTTNREILSMFKRISEMDARSYGEIVNSFLELEADYVVHWREVVGRKAWLIGPVVLCNEEYIEKSSRGGNPSIGTEDLLQWLDSKHPGSVVYICFGSITNLNTSLEQLMNIAIALEESDRDFIWVVNSSNLEGYDDWLEGFEQRMHKEKRSLIIRGWAPQLLVLNHPALGGFLTHCGWNSTIEAISAGVPMITWPMSGDQFFNEKLIVEMLNIGAAIGIKEGPFVENRQLIEAETIKCVIERVLGEGAEGEAMRKRAKELKEIAKAALQEGGSSYADLDNLIEELLARRNSV
ncbi:scopoletin glucosyltransferase-like [Carex rostrata]